MINFLLINFLPSKILLIQVNVQSSSNLTLFEKNEEDFQL